jgi:hypothetical protein
LSEETIKEINDIAKRQGVSPPDVISVLVHLYSEGEDFDTADKWFEIVSRS